MLDRSRNGQADVVRPAERIVALSLSGRKLFAEVAGTLAILVAGAVVLTHRPQTEQLMTQAFGIKFAPRVAATLADTPSDAGNSRSSRSRTVELAAGNYGHFYADAEINGRSVNVVVDTGASMVALTYEDARRAGFSLRDSDFTGRTSTANGVSRVAPVMIDRLSIGDIEVRNVPGVVAAEGALHTTLLGMTFLGKLSSVAMKSGRLVLEE